MANQGRKKKMLTEDDFAIGYNPDHLEELKDKA